MDLLTVTVQARHIRRVRGASMTLTDGSRRRPDAGLLAFAVVVLPVYLTLILLIAGLLTAVIPPRWGIAGAMLAVVAPMSPLLVELAARIVRLLRTPEARTLGRRHQEIADQSDRPVLMIRPSFGPSSQAKGLDCCTPCEPNGTGPALS